MDASGKGRRMAWRPPTRGGRPDERRHGMVNPERYSSTRPRVRRPAASRRAGAEGKEARSTGPPGELGGGRVGTGGLRAERSKATWSPQAVGSYAAAGAV